MKSRAPVAIIVQRYHADIAGGAESLARQYAGLLGDHMPVHVLSTRALSAESWENQLPAGKTEEGGVSVTRFNVDGGRAPRWERLNRLLWAHYRDRRARTRVEPPRLAWPSPLQEEWIRAQGPYSSELLNYLRAHRAEYRAFIFVTYLYAPTYFGLLLAPRERSILVPAVHDEAPAYLPVFERMARRPGRVFWNTEAEREFGEKLWGVLPGRVVSMGVDAARRASADSSVAGPYVLYCGRIDAGKGCAEMIEFLARFRREQGSGPRLILTGNLQMRLPRADWIEYRGFVPEEEKRGLMAGARVFLMPSLQESLSLVTLEAMAEETPVLGNGHNPVIREHAAAGGLVYGGYEDFSRGLRRLLAEPEAGVAMGRAGREYVLAKYDLERVRARLLEEVEALPPPTSVNG